MLLPLMRRLLVPFAFSLVQFYGTSPGPTWRREIQQNGKNALSRGPVFAVKPRIFPAQMLCRRDFGDFFCRFIILHVAGLFQRPADRSLLALCSLAKASRQSRRRGLFCTVILGPKSTPFFWAVIVFDLGQSGRSTRYAPQYAQRTPGMTRRFGFPA